MILGGVREGGVAVRRNVGSMDTSVRMVFFKHTRGVFQTPTVCYENSHRHWRVNPPWFSQVMSHLYSVFEDRFSFGELERAAQ